MWKDKVRSTGDIFVSVANIIPIFWRAAPRYLSLLLLLLPVQGLIPAFNIWLLKLIIDSLTTSPGTTSEGAPLLWLLSLWALLTTCGALLSPWIALIQGNLNEKLTSHVNLMMMNKANDFRGIAPFEDSKFYDDMQVLQREARFRPLNTIVTLISLLRALITLGATLFILSTLTWWLPLILVASSLPAIRSSMKLYASAWQAIVGSSSDARRMQYSSNVVMSDEYAKEVRLFRLGDFFVESYRKAFSSLHSLTSGSRLTQAYRSIPAVLLASAGSIYGFWWVVTNALRGGATAGDLVLLIQALSQARDALSSVTQYSGLLQEHVLFFNKFQQFMESESSIRVTTNAVQTSHEVPPEIEFKDVSFKYPDGRVALHKVSFKVRATERVALVGDNGAGKTTIVKLLLRFYDPDEGVITIDGLDLKQLDLDSWRRRVGVVFQDYGKYQLTVRENVAIGNIDEIGNKARVEEAIHRVGANGFVRSLSEAHETQLGKQFGGTELSGGQWQKVAVARAVVSEAGLLILDEPTASLDPRSEYELYQDFANLSVDTTVLLITHRLASIKMVDRIVVLKNGGVVEQGTHKNLIEYGGEYNALYKMQAESYSEDSFNKH